MHRDEDDLLPFQLHAAYVMFWALTCFLMRWDHMGSMFGGPSDSSYAQKEGQEQSAKSEAVEAPVTVGVTDTEEEHHV